MTDYLPLPGEQYKHYKGGTYEIISLGTHTETGEVDVIYRSLNFGSVYVRPLAIFNSSLDIGTEPRFRKIEK